MILRLSRTLSVVLIMLLMFGALSAFGGAVLAFTSHGAGIALDELAGSWFSSFVVLGLILGVVVGGTQSVAAVALLMRRQWAPMIAAVAGFGMLIWIFTEVALFGYSWLQSLYFGLGLLELILVLGRMGIAPGTMQPRLSASAPGDQRALVSGTGTRGPNRLPPLWTGFGAGAALLAAAGSIIALLIPERIYGLETPVLADAGIAQDLVNLFLVTPLTLVFAGYAFRGSLRSWLCLIGVLAFTVYNYAIYAFSIHFGPLFLLWVAVLGLSGFSLAGTAATLSTAIRRERVAGPGVHLSGWFLIAAAVVFAVLWLSEIVPDLLAGRPSTSAANWKVPTDPVHVLDLAFFLPAVFISGSLLLRRHPAGGATAAGSLVFLSLTCLPILLTPVVASLRGDAPQWSIMLPMGVIAAATLVVLGRLLPAMKPPAGSLPEESGRATRQARTT